MSSGFLARSNPPPEELQTANANPGSGTEQQFLRFNLLPETTAMLPVSQMTEVLAIPMGQIVPIPQMPAWVMGVYNWRGEVLWLVDLGNLLGMDSIYQSTASRSTYTTIVIHNATQPGNNTRKMLGLVVNQVEDMESCDPDLIQSSLNVSVSPDLVPFLRGYWLKSSGDIMVALDGNAIIARMPQP
ncbi:MAG: chemotaxis protein CheW [Cyanosarcina radialis HA8281-LM2]|jgi:positive phototaxis protein PixI|nr:chemotaxis protein CheW [Cyanosarcina radialis HA8281-LM2]